MNHLRITTVQADLAWENPAANLEMFSKIIGSLSDTEVVVLPEMFSTGFSMQPQAFAETMDGPTVCWMRETAAQYRIILTGSLMVREGERFFNRLIWMLPNGNLGHYDKRHLFAFAGEHEHYSPGNKRLIAQVNGWRILLLICYDLRFPVWSRQQLQPDGPEFDAIVYVANWPERRSEAWKTLLQARAIENQCYVIGVNRVGNDGNGIYHDGQTSVVDPLGNVLYRKAHQSDTATHLLDAGELQAIRQKLPFWKDGDRFSIF